MQAPWNPDCYKDAWDFASRAHNGQLVPGSDIPYIHHVGAVTMEVMVALGHSPDVRRPDLAVLCALLHDVLEDTDEGYDAVETRFGREVAEGVQALSKDPSLPTKAERMADSLSRIVKQPPEVWMVKMADRIANLEAPPHYWDREKTRAYRLEAETILGSLRDANRWLAGRLARKIVEYEQYC